MWDAYVYTYFISFVKDEQHKIDVVKTYGSRLLFDNNQSKQHDFSKRFRRRNTPNNLTLLRVKEDTYDSVCEKAKREWTDQTCMKINEGSNPKEMWEHFRNLTTYEDQNTGGVLPLLDSENKAIFSNTEKSKILQDVFFGGGHLEGEDFDQTFKEEVEKRLEEIVNEQAFDEEDLATQTQYVCLNRDISLEETEAAIQRLEKGKSPGADLIYTDLLKSAGEELINAIHFLFSKSWKERKLPDKWKHATVKFMMKTGKKNYHLPSAYRPISLTSCLGKCLEKIIVTRLYGYAEHCELFDNEQEGFRRFRSTTQALLRLTQDIANGFNKREMTVAVMIDLEKAYDSVWRDGLLLKLYEKGIRGKIWFWLRDFLKERTAVCSLRNQEGVQFQTNLGLPQGSVLSPLLFNLYIADIYEHVTGQKVKFADDGTVWRSGQDLESLAQELQKDLAEISQWVRKWRMKVNVDKTEYCIFSREQTVLNGSCDIKMTNQVLKRSRSPKLLGVTFDEKLTFSEHIKNVELRAQKTVSALRTLGRTEHIDPENMIKLYRCILLPQLEYASPVWQAGNCGGLEKVQRRGLAACLGVPATAATEALEVEAGVLPLHLRREELAVRELGKIKAKKDHDLIKASLINWEEDFKEEYERVISPFGKMGIQFGDMCSNTEICCNNIEPEVNYQETLQPSRRKPDYWNNLGSSKNRTTVQEEESRKIIESAIEESEPRSVFAFTDGSCRENPGPCGAGACILLPDGHEFVELKQPVSKLASILLGELVAISMALTFLEKESNRQQFSSIKLFSDSQSAVGIVSLGWETKSHKQTVTQIQQSVRQLQQKGIDVQIAWSPGHADIMGNEIADRLAKEAAQDAEDMVDDNRLITMVDIKTAARRSCVKKWQRQWDQSDKGRTLYSFRPTVDLKKNKYCKSKFPRIISKLRTGYCLTEYLHKVGLSDTSVCNCGEVESVEHYIQECQKYEDIREYLSVKLHQLTGICEWTPALFLDLKVKDIHEEFRLQLTEIFDEFIEKSKRFSKM
ncbi:MAG: reverse transcriptase domain-containing protein [Candidatus Thiodiazotropha sp.]